MAYIFARKKLVAAYKGRKIEKAESPLQEVYIVDGDAKNAYWSIADAKRAINGQPLKYLPVDVRHWFR